MGERRFDVVDTDWGHRCESLQTIWARSTGDVPGEHDAAQVPPFAIEPTIFDSTDRGLMMISSVEGRVASIRRGDTASRWHLQGHGRHVRPQLSFSEV